MDTAAVGVDTHELDGVVVARLRGPLTAQTAPPVRDTLLPLLTRRGPWLVVDGSGVEQLDAVGAQVLVTLARRAELLDGALRLAGCRPSVLAVLRGLPLERHLPVSDTVAEAVEALDPLGELAELAALDAPGV